MSRLSQIDGIKFLADHVAPLRKEVFVYLDPPYFVKGRDLYLNHYKSEDHATLATYLKRKAKFPWVLSYDNVPEITKLYDGLRQIRFDLNYSARVRRVGSEIMVLKPGLAFPLSWKARIPPQYISSADDVVIPLAG